MSEAEPLLPAGFAERIENDLRGDLGATRRMALAYLERPFREVVELIERDRGFAVAIAHVADVLKGHVQSYQTLADWMKAAHTRMAISLAAREDMSDVLQEAHAATAQAAREKFGKKFLTVLKGGKS
jgi:hypothetical protein